MAMTEILDLSRGVGKTCFLGGGEAHLQPAFCVNMQECPVPYTLPRLMCGGRYRCAGCLLVPSATLG